jgi:hypothetical protein
MRIIAGGLTLSIVLAFALSLLSTLNSSAASLLALSPFGEERDASPTCALTPSLADLELHRPCTRWP